MKGQRAWAVNESVHKCAQCSRDGDADRRTQSQAKEDHGRDLFTYAKHFSEISQHRETFGRIFATRHQPALHRTQKSKPI